MSIQIPLTPRFRAERLLDCWKTRHKARFSYLLDEMNYAVKNKDGKFFDQLARLIKSGQVPQLDALRAWLLDEHLKTGQLTPRFTQEQLVKKTKAKRFFDPNQDNENVRRQLMRVMKGLGIPFLNSPVKTKG